MATVSVAGTVSTAPVNSTADSGGSTSVADAGTGVAVADSAPQTDAPVPAANVPVVEAAGADATAVAPALHVANATAPTPAKQLRPKPLPIPIEGNFTAVHKPSTKAAQGTARFEVSIPWDDGKMYYKAKMAMYVPPIAKVISTTLGQKPRDNVVSVTLTLPSSFGTDNFALGAVSIISGAKPTPTAPPAMPAAPSAPPQPAVVPPPSEMSPAGTMPVVAAVPMQFAVQAVVAQATAVAAAAAAVQRPAARPAVVAVAVQAPKRADKLAKKSAKRPAAAKPKATPPAKPARPSKQAPKRKAAPTVAPSKRARKAPSPPPVELPSSRSGRIIKAAAKFGDKGELSGAASSFRSTPIPSKTLPPQSTETNIPAFAQPGSQVFANGLHAGIRKRFRATVLKIRTSWPRIVVRYDSTEDGLGTSAIELPEMKSAYLSMADIDEITGP